MEISHYLELLSRFEEKYYKEEELKKSIREKYNLKENVSIQIIYINPENKLERYLSDKNYVYWVQYNNDIPNTITMETEKLINVFFITEYEKENYKKYNIKEKEFKVTTVALIDETNNNIINLLSALSEKFSKIEIQCLSEVCQCAIHQMQWFNPCKYIYCKCCYGCLEEYDSNPNNGLMQNTIKKTRQMLNNKK